MPLSWIVFNTNGLGIIVFPCACNAINLSTWICSISHVNTSETSANFFEYHRHQLYFRQYVVGLMCLQGNARLCRGYR